MPLGSLLEEEPARQVRASEGLVGTRLAAATRRELRHDPVGLQQSVAELTTW